jgi:DDE family transposase
MTAARCQHLLDLLAKVPDPRKKRGRRHPLAGLLAVGIAAVIAGSKSFAAIGQWAGDAGPDVLAALGAERGPAEESTYRLALPDTVKHLSGHCYVRLVDCRGNRLARGWATALGGLRLIRLPGPTRSRLKPRRRHYRR